MRCRLVAIKVTKMVARGSILEDFGVTLATKWCPRDGLGSVRNFSRKKGLGGVPGSPRESPGVPRSPRESPGVPGSPRESPGVPGSHRQSPGVPRSPRESPGGPPSRGPPAVTTLRVGGGGLQRLPKCLSRVPVSPSPAPDERCRQLRGIFKFGLHRWAIPPPLPPSGSPEEGKALGWRT